MDWTKLALDTVELPQLVPQSKHALYSHSAVFAEVSVDEDLGTVHVNRIVSATAGGRILNPLTARSQIVGAIVWASAWRWPRRECSTTTWAAS